MPRGYGLHCGQAADIQAAGYRQADKGAVFEWLTMLVGELDKYHRCKREQCYRYLNPYSVLVTAENKIFLLDLSAASNGFVLQNMQKPLCGSIL